ncbi:tigger transposable element-derived protein 6-like [Anneissia japonica]|uniref:tigger transposable element-derived protein 6-like n=1 Tax=Anneissia japonica TaxID=1529436 RepID=UPI0014255BB3|nr:tigger transposable element-derived protein 6-like [Anneissia japonica]
MATKRKRTELDVAMKLRLIDDIDNGMKRIEVAQKYGVGSQRDMNQLMLVWFRTARDKNIPIIKPLIKAKAMQFAEQLNIIDFGASDGWLTKWKQRNKIKQVAVCDERGDVDQTIVTEWKSKIADLCAGYQPEDIFNCDETGLYFRALPDRTLAEKQDDVTGIKTSKDRITLKPMVINRAENPRCFKNIKEDQLPVVWKANRKAWMTGALFDDYLNDLNRQMKFQRRHILLFLDNASSHVDVNKSNMKLAFLPANTTSVLQPLDQGIIKAFKSR